MADRPESSLTAAMEQERISMFLMSENLLRALWREHPEKLRYAASQGRKVEAL